VTDDLDMRDGLDAIQSDMAAHQARFKGEVTAEANRALAVAEFERLDQELAAAHPDPEPPMSAVADVPQGSVTKDVDGRKYTVTFGPEGAIRKANRHELWFLQHAGPRIELLLTKIERGPLGSPSWSERIKACAAVKSQVPVLLAAGFKALAAEYERRFTMELLAVLEDSNRLFGDWKADAPTKVMVGP
jgi:hypothetical protein